MTTIRRTMTMLNVERMMMKKKEGCRSASGDYHHKAWVGAILNIHSTLIIIIIIIIRLIMMKWGLKKGEGDFGLEWRKESKLAFTFV